jgi:phospholipid transport system transporter-binding protein
MIVRDGDCFRVQGPVTMANVEALIEEGRAAFTEPEVTVDLGAVTEVDSTAVSLLLQWLRDAAAQGRRLTFRGLTHNIHSLAVLYGVADLIPIDNSGESTRTGASG